MHRLHGAFPVLLRSHFCRRWLQRVQVWRCLGIPSEILAAPRGLQTCLFGGRNFAKVQSPRALGRFKLSTAPVSNLMRGPVRKGMSLSREHRKENWLRCTIYCVELYRTRVRGIRRVFKLRPIVKLVAIACAKTPPARVLECGPRAIRICNGSIVRLTGAFRFAMLWRWVRLYASVQTLCQPPHEKAEQSALSTYKL